MSDNYDIKDIDQAEGGRRRIDWASTGNAGSAPDPSALRQRETG